MFSWYKYLIVSLVFSHLGFWSGNLFLIAPFPDLCLLVPSHSKGWGAAVPAEFTVDTPPRFENHVLAQLDTAFKGHPKLYYALFPYVYFTS